MLFPRALHNMEDLADDASIIDPPRAGLVLRRSCLYRGIRIR